MLSEICILVKGKELPPMEILNDFEQIPSVLKKLQNGQVVGKCVVRIVSEEVENTNDSNKRQKLQ